MTTMKPSRNTAHNLLVPQLVQNTADLNLKDEGALPKTARDILCRHLSNIDENSSKLAAHTAEWIGGTFEANRKLHSTEIAQFERQGIGPDALERLRIRTGDVVWAGPNRFEFRQHAWSGDPDVKVFLILVLDRTGAPVDIVAWEPGTNQVGTWLGSTWAIGQGSVLKPRLSEGLRVHRSPWGWLRSRGKGIVILNYRVALLHLDAAGPLLAEDEQHRAELEAALTPPSPRIFVASNAKGVSDE